MTACPHCAYNPTQCAYAMGALLERLISEGYISEDKKKDLAERAANLKRGAPFLPEPKPPTPSIEDLLS